MDRTLSLRSQLVLALLWILLVVALHVNAAPISSSPTNAHNATVTAINNSSRKSTNNTCNCTSEDTQHPVCGSNSETFESKAKLCHYNCEHNKSLTVKYPGQCRNCTEYSMDSFESTLSLEERRQLIFKCFAETYTHEDLIAIPPYRPECFSGDKNHIFKPLQQLTVCQLHWCAAPDGSPITGTVKHDKEPLNCNGICVVNNGTSYNNGDKFIGNCGICQCLQGTLSCMEDYCEIDENEIDVLNSLKIDILKFFTLQYQHSDPKATVGLHYIRAHKIDIRESEITKVCSWKFQHYDKDNDESLNSSDQQNFYEEVYRLIGTKSFEGHFDRLIDTDNNGAISKQEFRDLFNLEEASGSFSSSSGRRSVN